MTVWIDAAAVERLVGHTEAADAIEAALTAGLDLASDPPRLAVEAASGQILLMPGEHGGRAGVKVVTVAADNPGAGLPRVQGVYVLMEAATLSPIAVIDGTALTSLRTPAVSAVAVRQLASPDASTLVLFGTGPQAWGHVAAVRAVRPVTEVVIVARDRERADAFVHRVAATGIAATSGDADAVAGADIVVCATTAGEPLFDGASVAGTACVVAVGSHHPHRRELDGRLMARSTVVVEDVPTALREAGDVVMAIAEGATTPADLHGLADLVVGRVGIDPTGPRVFKSVGMAWEDLVVADRIHRAHTNQT